MRRHLTLLLAALLLVSCSTFVGETPIETVAAPTTGPTAPSTTGLPTTTVPAPRQCVVPAESGAQVNTGSVAGDAIALSTELFACADDMVVVGEADLNHLATAAQLAAALGGPLLHPDPGLLAEMRRLQPMRVHLIGPVEVDLPSRVEVVRPTTTEAVAMAAEALGVTSRIRLPSSPDTSTVVETIRAITTGDRVVLPRKRPPGATTTAPVPAIDPAVVINDLAMPTGTEFVWLVDAAQPAAAMSAAGTGRAIGASVIAWQPGNLLAYPQLGPALAGRPVEDIRLIGSAPPASPWEIATVIRGRQVPGGGLLVFPPNQPRRYVAFYGNPITPALGALGEQGPQATLDRMAPLLAEYAADGHQVIPTFEIIATVASAGATSDGDYSEETPTAALTEWIDVATANGAYVILDLQSGREDFLSQAKLYEELLRLPNVGLALDPEWRLQPDQVHLRQTGQVEAAEVNAVLHWLADLVRDNELPQKMMIVHQFLSSMIVNREMIEQRPEVQLVIQMDGQGPIHTKDETYAFLTAGTENAPWRWGWKNFFDEDSPETASPAYTIAHTPVPVFVSYQ